MAAITADHSAAMRSGPSFTAACAVGLAAMPRPPATIDPGAPSALLSLPGPGENVVKIEEARFDNLIVLRPLGRLDNVTSAEFQTKLLQLTASATADLIIDFALVDYISSGGLRALVMAVKQKPARHRVGVAGLNALVQEIFSIAHFEQVLPVFASPEEARLAWADPAPRGAG